MAFGIFKRVAYGFLGFIFGLFIALFSANIIAFDIAESGDKIMGMYVFLISGIIWMVVGLFYPKIIFNISVRVVQSEDISILRMIVYIIIFIVIYPFILFGIVKLFRMVAP